ncbi:VOC family protein [Rhizobium sp. BK251]|uniref:VOC family protein n=1 Tax=Rhizobium sp. BK251 TaxID=2512125 RepID=UPI00104F72F5|nr:VOC family protein [Rhizobium sp. BK251]TCL71039.1 glyoxalase/bleomycin resistance protein/dioxygenase superfamily protein [Rhizobium sp. BK251]
MENAFLEEDAIMQLCFVTDDVERTAAWFGDLIGRSDITTAKAADPAVAKAKYLGKDAVVSCKIKFMRFGNIDLEFLEPGPEPSAWRDLLGQRGPGLHHIAFRTSDMTGKAAYLTGKGHPLIQSGEFDGGGGRYAYFDTNSQLGALIELLEFDRTPTQSV